MTSTSTAGLPTFVVIGAMKCGTTALHRYLDLHPEVSMSRPKELNFFFGPENGAASWTRGNWARGRDWYERHFEDAHAARGESSPGYTSPGHPEVAGRMASVIPDARLICVVRDPLERAVSQYLHHRRDGDERRPVEAAILDEHSQYIARSRFYERLEPFLRRFGRERIHIVTHRRLLADRRATMRAVFAFVGVDEDYWSPEMDRRWHVSPDLHPEVRPPDAARFRAAVADDMDRLRRLVPDRRL